MRRSIIAATVAMMGLVAACRQEPAAEVPSNDGAVAKLERPAPEVVGIDQDGNSFSSSSLSGRVWLASFMFTNCQTVCPALNTVQAGLVKKYAGKGLRFVSISTDPENDTPEAMKAYGARYGAQTGTWWMLRMPIDTVMKVATRGFAVMAPEHPDMHSTRFVLVDAKQQIHDYFDSADTAEVIRLERTLDAMLKEAH